MKKMLMIVAFATALVSCGGGGGRPSFGDNEYPVVTVGTSSADMQTTYPAMIKGVQDVEIRPKGCSGCGDSPEGAGFPHTD